MSDFSILRVLPSADAPEGNTPALVQREAGGSIERTTLAAVGDHLDPGRPVRLVIPSSEAVMTEVALSRKQARHLQKVLPYLLEETLLGDPAGFWFSWNEPDKGEAAAERWPVLAIKREHLMFFRDYLAQQGFYLQSASTDGALAAAQAPLRLADSSGVLLVPDRHRALLLDAAAEPEIVSALQMEDTDWYRIEGDDAAFSLFREAFDSRGHMELLHSDMRPMRRQQETMLALGPWRPLAWLAAGIVLAASVLLAAQQWRYSNAAEASQQQAAAAYQRLFPGDRASSGLRRQFQARLNRLGGGGAGGGFLVMMEPVGQVLAQFREQGLDSRRLRYDERQGLITVDVEAKDFDVLEQVRGAINERGLKAEIATARNEGSGVKARLKVEQG